MPEPNPHRGPAGTAWAALAASFATLLCCVVPALLVAVGLGTTVAALTSAVPWIVTLSRHKGWVFLAAGLLILGSRLYTAAVAPKFTTAGAACPPTMGQWTRRAWHTSVVLYLVSFLTVYVVGPLLVAGSE